MAEAVVAAKLVEDRYIVLFPCHVIKEQKPKHKEPEAKQHNTKHKQKQPTQKTENHTTPKQWRDGYQLGEKDLWDKRW